MLTCVTFSPQHRTKLHSTNLIERPNGEIKRRTEVVGIFPNEDAIVRLVGATLLEQSDEWAVQRARYMTLETIAPLSDDPGPQPSGSRQRPARLSPALAVTHRQLHHARGTIESRSLLPSGRLPTSRTKQACPMQPLHRLRGDCRRRSHRRRSCSLLERTFSGRFGRCKQM